jgi:heat shock protein HslJ
MRKTLVILLLLTVLVLSACGAQPAATQPAATLEGTSWKLVSYGPVDSQTPAVADVETSLMFDAQGRMSGKAGCNGFSGDYKAADGTLTPSQLMTTLMACSDPLMTQESAVLAVLNGALHYEIKQDTLSITSADGNSMLVFTRAPAVSYPG